MKIKKITIAIAVSLTCVFSVILQLSVASDVTSEYVLSNVEALTTNEKDIYEIYPCAFGVGSACIPPNGITGWGSCSRLRYC